MVTPSVALELPKRLTDFKQLRVRTLNPALFMSTEGGRTGTWSDNSSGGIIRDFNSCASASYPAVFVPTFRIIILANDVGKYYVTL